MKTLLRILGVTVLLALMVASCQAHTATITWTNSPDTPNTNVYRLSGACPATLTGFTLLTPTPVATGTYTDATITPGAYCYYVTAVVGGAESAPSPTASATVLPASPSAIVITIK